VSLINSGNLLTLIKANINLTRTDNNIILFND
jgi:hypothetical protein